MEFDLDNSGDIGMIRYVFLFVTLSSLCICFLYAKWAVFLRRLVGLLAWLGLLKKLSISYSLRAIF